MLFTLFTLTQDERYSNLASLFIHYDLIALLALIAVDVIYRLFCFRVWANKMIIRSILFFVATLIVTFIGSMTATGHRSAAFYWIFVEEALFCSLFFIAVLTAIEKGAYMFEHYQT